MPFQPTPAQAKAQAHAALRIGLGVGIRDDDALWVAFAAETLNPDQLSQALDLGGAEMIITHRRAETLKISIAMSRGLPYKAMLIFAGLGASPIQPQT